MKDVHADVGLKNMSDPVLKQIYGIYETKNPTKGQTKKCKMTEREVFEKYDNLSEGELNTKNNKKILSEMILWLLLLLSVLGTKK